MMEPAMRRSGSQGARLRQPYGYVLGAILLIGLIGGLVAVIENGGRVPAPDRQVTGNVDGGSASR
jgi:hypothetical protein